MEARKMRKIEMKIMDVFEKFGCDEVITPIIEKEEVAKIGIGEPIIKFFDFSLGEYITPREDFTPQVINTDKKKVCYRGQIFRFDKNHKKYIEMYQVGCEIFENTEEIFKILKEVLILLQNENIKVKIIFGNTLFQYDKDLKELKRMVDEGEITLELAKMIFNIHKIKNAERKIHEMFPGVEILSEFDILFDLSKKPEREYHKGIHFSGYHNKKQIISGGEYIIRNKKGIGFSIILSSL